MFERYTEAARRALFFARYETSELGALAIEPEHILLGVLRVDKEPARRLFAEAHLSLDSARAAIHASRGARERVPTSVEIPFSAETQRVLHYAAEESDRLLHSYIGTEHLVLGLLREVGSMAASILASHGLTLDRVREVIVQMFAEAAAPDTFGAGGMGFHETFTVAARPHPETARDRLGPKDEIDDIKLRLDQLVEFHPDDDRVRDLIVRIRRDLDALKGCLG
jgi:ATP-dependent Clp protease ATP-binding subunit ClpC